MKRKLPNTKCVYFIKNVLFLLFVSMSFNTIAQVPIFSENFDSATGDQNIANPYQGWQIGQFTTSPPTNNNYWWVFNNSHCNVINGSHSMAVSRNTPATSGVMPRYYEYRAASTLVYNTNIIDATNYTNLTMDFNWYGEGETGNDYASVIYSSDGLTWAGLPGVYNGQSTQIAATTLDLSALDGQTFYIGFRWVNDRENPNSNNVGNSSFVVDDIVVRGIELTPCVTPNQPTGLTLNPTGNSINGSFTAAMPNPSGYLVVVSTSNTAPTPNNATAYAIGDLVGAGYTVVDNDANTTFTATGLTPATLYYIYVFSYNTGCLGGPQYSSGALSGSTTTTNSTYCTPTTSNSRSVKYINDVQFIGTLNDVSNLGNSYFQPNNSCTLSTLDSGYQDWTCKPKSIQAQGEGVNIYVGSNTGRGRYKAWVDWNNDGVFDNNPANGELVYTSGGVLTTTTTFGFVIPANQDVGDYRIRIRFHGATNNSGIELTGAYNFTACQNFGTLGNGNNRQYHYGEAEDYLFTVIPSCLSKITSVTDGATCGPGTVMLEATSATASLFKWYANKTGGASIATTNGTWAPFISATTTYWVTAFNGIGTCESLVRTKVVATLNPVTDLTIVAGTSVCGENDIVEISATGDTELAYLINEDFEGGLGDFTSVNYDLNNGTIDNLSQWQIQTSTYVPANSVWFPAISSGFSTNNFVMSTSDVNPSYYIENSLESLTVDTSTFIDLTLEFDIYFSRYVYDNSEPLLLEYVFIDVSVDGGANWTNVQTYDNDIGYGTSFESRSLDLNAYVDEPNLKIRFYYFAAWCDGVALDNIQLFGEKPLTPSFTWTSATPIDAYTTPTATPGSEYTPGNVVTGPIYVKPTLLQLEESNFTFTANATLSNGCTISKDITVQNKTKVWRGLSSNWNDPGNWKPNGVPDNTNCVIIPDHTIDPIISGGTDGDAYNLLIKDGGYLLQQPDATLTVVDVVTVDSGGLYYIQSSGSLIQTNNVSNTINGDFLIERAPGNGVAVNNLNYVYWASPVANFAVTNISPGSSHIYKWIPTIPANGIGHYGNWAATGETMVSGKGYIVRGLSGVPTNPIPAYPSITVTTNAALFRGAPNNGDIEIPIYHGNYNVAGNPGYPGAGGTAYNNDDNWNLIGNPYPSAISADAFIDANAGIIDDDGVSPLIGAVWLWPHQGVPSTANTDPFYYNFVSNYADQYIKHNRTGTSPPPPGGAGDVFLASGQAFFVLAEHTANPNGGDRVVFNNSMRDAAYSNSVFYRTENPNSTSPRTIEKNRIWLDFVNPENNSNTILIGYVEGATNENDKMYDAPEFEGFKFYSIIDNDKFSIQGRALPFEGSDRVQLGFNTASVGNFKIAINRVDGLFENTEQNIFLEDTYNNFIHDLRISPYSFNSQTGTFNDRFILRYTNNTLGVDEFASGSAITITAPNNSYIKVIANTSPIKSISIYDVLGRTLYSNNSINELEFRIDNVSQSDAVLFVKAILENGVQKTQKVVLKQ